MKVTEDRLLRVLMLLTIGIISYLVLSGCGRSSKITTNFIMPSALTTKAELYSQLIKTHQDANGFIHSDKCDSLMFTALAATRLDFSVDILAAREDSGKWFRRPAKDCLEKGESRSTISRDMLLGLYWYIWMHKDINMAKELYAYGENTNWLMGDWSDTEGLSRVVLTPAMISTLAQMIHVMSGEDYKARHLPVPFTLQKEGYRSHLTGLHLLLRYRIFGGFTDNEYGIARDLAKREPGNPLFQIVVGNKHNAAKILLKESLYPADRLPSTADRCPPWLPERAIVQYGPCPSPLIEHTGGDLLFLYRVMQ